MTPLPRWAVLTAAVALLMIGAIALTRCHRQPDRAR